MSIVVSSCETDIADSTQMTDLHCHAIGLMRYQPALRKNIFLFGDASIENTPRKY